MSRSQACLPGPSLAAKPGAPAARLAPSSLGPATAGPVTLADSGEGVLGRAERASLGEPVLRGMGEALLLPCDSGQPQT